MYRVGLTGGIGSGKSLICSILEKLGVSVYYADAEARSLMDSDPVLKVKIVGLFGEQAYSGGSLDRQYLAGRLFGDAELLASMNTVVHPAVREDFKRWADLQKGVPYVVEEAAILFESGAYHNVDVAVLVIAPTDLRIERVAARDGSTREEILQRMNNQWTQERKAKLADHIINNDGAQLIIPQVLELHKRFSK